MNLARLKRALVTAAILLVACLTISTAVSVACILWVPLPVRMQTVEWKRRPAPAPMPLGWAEEEGVIFVSASPGVHFLMMSAKPGGTQVNTWRAGWPMPALAADEFIEWRLDGKGRIYHRW